MLSFKNGKTSSVSVRKVPAQTNSAYNTLLPAGRFKIALEEFNRQSSVVPAGNPGTCSAVFTVVNTASVPKILPGAGDVGLSPNVFPVNVTAPGTVVVKRFIKGTQSSHFNYSKSALYYKM